MALTRTKQKIFYQKKEKIIQKKKLPPLIDVPKMGKKQYFFMSKILFLGQLNPGTGSITNANPNPATRGTVTSHTQTT